MNTFEHLVITRFNVKLHDGTLTSKGNNPDWLAERFNLKIPLAYGNFPSLVQQASRGVRQEQSCPAQDALFQRKTLAPSTEDH